MQSASSSITCTVGCIVRSSHTGTFAAGRHEDRVGCRLPRSLMHDPELAAMIFVLLAGALGSHIFRYVTNSYPRGPGHGAGKLFYKPLRDDPVDCLLVPRSILRCDMRSASSKRADRSSLRTVSSRCEPSTCDRLGRLMLCIEVAHVLSSGCLAFGLKF